MAFFATPLNNLNEDNEATTAAYNTQNYEPADFDLRLDLLRGFEPTLDLPNQLVNNFGVQQPDDVFYHPQQPQPAYDGYNFGQYQLAQDTAPVHQITNQYQSMTGQYGPYCNYQNAPPVQNVNNVYYGYENAPMPAFNHYNHEVAAGQPPQRRYPSTQQVDNHQQRNITTDEEDLNALYDQRADHFVHEVAQSFLNNTWSQESTLVDTSPEDVPSQEPSPTASLPILPSQQQQDGSPLSNAVVNLDDEVEIIEVPTIDLTEEDEVAVPPTHAPMTQPLARKRKSNPSWLNMSANIEEAARNNSAKLLIKAQTEQGRARLKERRETKKAQREKKEQTKQELKEKNCKSQTNKRKKSDTNNDNLSGSPTKKTCSTPEKAVEELSTPNSGFASQYTEDEMTDLLQFADDCDQELAGKPTITPQKQYTSEEAEELAQFFFEEQDAENPSEEPQRQESESEAESEGCEDGWSLEEDLFGDADFLLAN